MGTFFAGESWKGLGASSEVVAALKALGITRPSHIQAEAYKALNAEGSRHVALADQAGSGKTLAYLVPLLQALKEEEAAAGKPGTVAGSPRVLIVAPTTELCQQVHRVLKALSGAGLRLRSGLMTGGQGEELRRAKAMRTQKEALEAGVDVAVMTPGRAVQLLTSGALSLEATRAVVLDEVDVLCAGEAVYREQVEPLQAAAPLTTRFLLVSATLPQHTYEELRALFPGLVQAFGPGLHRVSAGVVEELVDCSGGDEVSLESGVQRKLEALSACLDRHKSQRVVVFCNKIEACRAVENHLRRKHGKAPGGTPVEVHAYHDAVSEPVRHAALGAFLAPSSPAAPAAARAPRPVVLVCTDRTSRGIDSAWCDHVVLFDFPRDPSEYVRRAGRTARGAGGRGVVSALVLGKQVPLARDIMDANQKGRPVHTIPGTW